MGTSETGKKKTEKTQGMGELFVSGEMITDTITEVIKRMEVGQVRIVGPLARRTDIQSCVKKLNSAVDAKEEIKIEQSRVYIFHPTSGVTLQECFAVHRVK